MKRTIQFFFLLTLTTLLTSCGDENHFAVDVDDIQIADVEIKRFEKAMFETDRSTFFAQAQSFQAQFPGLLNGDITDTFALQQVWSFFEDPYKQELYQLVIKDYSNVEDLEEELTEMFRHMLYHFPEWEKPEVYSYVSGLDFQLPVKYTGADAIIALDVYLPSGTDIYAQSRIPKYRLRRMQERRISADMAQQFAIAITPPPPSTPRLIDQMIYEGKIQYFIHAMIPALQDTVLFNYSPDQMMWCREHEAKIWAFMMENEFLFETKVPILKKFLEDGPFTSIFNKQSPSRIGSFIGYQIVLEYMMENDLELKDLVEETDYQKILQHSGYHPE